MKIKTKSGYEYPIYNLSEEEYNKLITEFNTEDYLNYSGEYSLYYTFEGIEILMYFLEKYRAKILPVMQELFYLPVMEVSPYILSDGRVVVVRSGSASILSSLEDLYRQKKRYNEPFRLKYIPENNIKPVKKIQYLPSNKKFFYYLLPKVVGEILAIDVESLDVSIFSESKPIRKWYELPDDLLLEYRKSYDSYTLYKRKNYEELEHYKGIINKIGKARNRGEKIDYGYINYEMCGRNPYGKDFENNILELINQLPSHLFIDQNDLTFTGDSLKKVETVLFLNIMTDEFVDAVFLPLLAYAGEIYTREVGGVWNLKYDKTFDTWTPEILHDKKNIQIANVLLKILDSENKSWKSLLSLLKL